MAIADVDEAGLKATAKSLPGPVLMRVLDVRDAADQYRFAAEVRAWLTAPLAAVFNNAGVAVASSVLDADPGDDEWLRQVNFDGAVNGTRAFLPILVEQDDGVIVNTSSVFGLLGMPYQSAYCASKFAVRGFTDALRQELRGSGVSAVTVHPGGITTNIARNARIRKDPEGRGRSHEQMAADSRRSPDHAGQGGRDHLPRGRAGEGPHPGGSRRLRLRRPGPGSADPLLRRHGPAREAAPGHGGRRADERARRRPDRRGGACPGSAPHITFRPRSRTRATSSSRPATSSAARGTCSVRSIDQFPRAGSRPPWRLGMSYAHDVVTLRHGKINDGSMRFSRLGGAPAPRQARGLLPDQADQLA